MVRLLTSTYSPFAVLLSVIFELYVLPLKGNYCRLSIWPKNESAYNLKLKKLYYKSIGGITEGSATLFTMHNSARKLIVNHITFFNTEVHCITSQIASLREHQMTGYIMVDKIW
jgi:hypothetical protein